MSNPIYNLAFDFGASSGRMILSKLEDGKITLEELHRFTNDPVRIGKVFYWDTFRLFHELKQGLKKAAAKNIPIQSLAIDTWGVDFALIDKDGNRYTHPHQSAQAIKDAADMINISANLTVRVHENCDKEFVKKI